MINDIVKLQNSAIYVKYIDYDYKFGDLDLLNSGGSLGKSQLTFGIFYDDIAMDETARLVFQSNLEDKNV